MGRSWQIGVLAALLLGAILRLACLGGEFWLDEIWSWDLSREAGSFWAIFTQRHDNNHHLNTLWLRLCPYGASWTVYRLHSVIAGLAGIVLAALVARRWGDADAVFAAFLTAGCYWLVMFSVEARGYSLAVYFALLALLALRRYLESSPRWALALFWLSSIAGFLSHLTFVHAYLGFVAWTLRRAGKERTSSGDEIRRMLVCHGVPGAFIVVFYLVSIRGMEVGGGPPARTTDVLIRLISTGLGGPAAGLEALPWLIGALILFAIGIWLLAKQPGEMWVFFAVAVVGSPALFLLFRRQEFLFERYLLIPFVFFLVLSGHALGALWRSAARRRSSWQPRLLALLVLFAVLCGDLSRVREFVQAGRGEFHQALAWIVEHDPAAIIEVTGDSDPLVRVHDFRVRKYVNFYAHYLSDPDRVVYRGKDDLPAGGAGWLLIHQPDEYPPPGLVEHDAAGNTYRLARGYPSRGPGSWGWFVYRRAS